MLYRMVQSGTEWYLGGKTTHACQGKLPEKNDALCALSADKSPLPKNRRIDHPNMETEWGRFAFTPPTMSG